MKKTYTSVPQRGVSMIELMISMAIGLVIMLAVFMLFSRISFSARNTDDAGRAMENGHFAMRLIGEDLRMAGFIGMSNDPARVEVARASIISGTASANCGSQGWPLQMLSATNQLAFVEYYPNLSTTNPISSCLTSTMFQANSPALVIRRATSDTVRDQNNNGSLAEDFDAADNQIYLQSNHQGALVFMGKDYQTNIRGANLHKTILRTTWAGSVATTVTVDAPVFRYGAYVYYIRPCSRPAGTTCAASDDNGSPIPTLVRLQLSNQDPAGFVETPVAEGVERIALMFGIDTDNNGTPDTYTATPADMGQVMTARISLLLRTSTSVAGHDDSVFTYTLANGATFTCAGATNCSYRRFLFNDTIQLKNYVYRRL